MGPQNSSTTNWIMFGLSCLTHVLLIGPAVYIISLSSKLTTSLFLWHPTCMSFGCGLLMTEAVLGISGEFLLSTMLSRTNRIKLHWVLHVMGLTLMVVGFSTIMVNKNNNGASHFTSDHGRLGLSTFIISLIVALGGVLTLYAGLISDRLSLASTKLIHGCGGIICIILLFATLISGLYRWWPGSGLGRGLTITSYVFGALLVLLKPLYATSLKIRGFFT